MAVPPSHLGACLECGKRARVPEAGRAYRCPACGGVVRAAADDAPGRPTDSPAPSRSRTDPESRRRAPGRRRRAAESSRTGWYLLGGLMALLSLGGALHGLGLTARLTPGEADIDRVVGAFVRAWEAGDVATVARFHHPTRRDGFEERLGHIAANRGWTHGFPPIQQSVSLRESASSGEPRQASTDLEWRAMADGRGLPEGVRLRWQFNPRRGRWSIYSLRITPPPLGERAAALADAWNTGDLDALRPFLGADRQEERCAMIERARERRAWASLPPIALRGVEGEAAASPFATASGGAPIATYRFVEGPGELRVTWRFSPFRDAWNAAGFDFP